VIIATVRLLATLLLCSAALAQEKVTVRVNAAATLGAFRPVWAWFGFDQPNDTYTPEGRKLLGELAALGTAPVYIGAHNLLNSGHGASAPQWGSTNVYTKAPAGYPIYNWTIGDRIIDGWRHAHLQALMGIGYMPEALSSHPQPYRRDGPAGPLPAGWAYPPKDYQAWSELVYRWVRHEVERYGPDEVQPWYWEVWNQPDTGRWQGTAEEFYKLYDYTAGAVKRALPAARVGGPASDGPKFLRAFLEHCVRGANAATGKTGAPLDFISFHAKADLAADLDVVESIPELRHKPVLIDQACCSVAALAQTMELARAHHINLAGVVTWNVDTPRLNAFRMLGKMSGQQVAAESSAAADVGAMAVRSRRKLDVLLWNNHDATQVELTVAGLPADSVELREAKEPSRRLEAGGGKAAVSVRLARQAVSLVELAW
jgi:xylan 1,4-beta-xylosidase